MKTKIIPILVFFSSSIGFSQIGPNNDAVFIDSLNNIGTEENYKFIRVVKNSTTEKDLYDVAFYSRSGKIERRGTTSNKFFMAFEGPCVYFYENGNRKKIENYSEKQLSGKQFEWYENGKIKLESEIVLDKKTNNSITKIIHFWNANNEQKVINGEGEYEEIEEFSIAHKTPLIINSKGLINNYLKEGTWVGNSIQKKFTYTEEYINGKLISGKRIDSLGVEIKYDAIFQQPKPKKGMEDFYRFVAKNFNPPDVQGLKGVIFATFIVDKDGKATDIKIIRDIGYGTGVEALRVIQKFDQWIPGSFRGEPVKVMYSLPITIHSNY